MLDLSKIEITEIDSRTLRGVLAFTVEIKSPVDHALLPAARNEVLLRFFEKFYREFYDEVGRLFGLAYARCNDQREREELLRESKVLRELVDFNARIDHDFFQSDEQADKR